MQPITLKFLDKEYNLNIRDEADRSVLAEVFKIREYRIAEPVIKEAKNPIIDAGAHAGFFTLYARALNEKVRIFAVEPEPNNVEVLTAHIKINKIKGVKVLPLAVADKTGERQLNISTDSHAHRLVGDLKMGFGCPTLITDEKTISVKTQSLSDFLKKNKITSVSLLKMDIEGGEYEVFANLDSITLGKIQSIILEYHNDEKRNYKEIEKKIRESGFGVQIFPSKFDKTMGFLFANNKRI